MLHCIKFLYLVHHMVTLVKVQQKVSVKSPPLEAGQRPKQSTPTNPTSIIGKKPSKASYDVFP